MHKHKYMNTNTNTKAQIRNYKRPQFKEWDRVAGHLISASPTINQNQNGQPVKRKVEHCLLFYWTTMSRKIRDNVKTLRAPDKQFIYELF